MIGSSNIKEAMFCPECGRDAAKAGLCIECTLEKQPASLKEFKLVFCSVCGRILYRGRWSDDLGGTLERLVKKNMALPEGVEAGDAKIEFESDGSRLTLKVDLLLSAKGSEKREKLEKTFMIVKDVCPECSRRGSSYFEAVLQLRVPGLERDVNPRLVSHTKKVRGGVDIYLTSLNYARAKATDYKNKGCRVKETAEQGGVREGKQIYRTTISVKPPPFSKGDFVEYSKKILWICGLGKRVECTDLETGKLKRIPINRLQDSKVLATKQDVRRMIVTEVTPDHIQLMDEGDYSTASIPRGRNKLEAGSVVDMVEINRRIFILNSINAK